MMIFERARCRDIALIQAFLCVYVAFLLLLDPIERVNSVGVAMFKTALTLDTMHIWSTVEHTSS